MACQIKLPITSEMFCFDPAISTGLISIVAVAPSLESMVVNMDCNTSKIKIDLEEAFYHLCNSLDGKVVCFPSASREKQKSATIQIPVDSIIVWSKTISPQLVHFICFLRENDSARWSSPPSKARTFLLWLWTEIANLSCVIALAQTGLLTNWLTGSAVIWVSFLFFLSSFLDWEQECNNCT